MSQLTSPRVTVVMIARERHGLTEATLECLVANTQRPYRLIYTDGQTPDWLWQRLAERAPEWGLELVRHDEPLWPQELRNRVLDSVTTDYVVFIDNDVSVSPDWLEKLVACADETNAGIVGPLYLWGNGQNKPKIHMACGSLTHINTPQGIVMIENHDLVNAYPDDVAEQLSRKPCDFVEFHCMLLRTAVLKKMGGMDADILNVHEHIDTALAVRKQGYTVYTEPAAQINYLAYAPYMLDDLPMHRWRWAEAPTETSIHNFCRKWQILDESLGFDGVRNLAKKLTMDVDPIRPAAMSRPDLKVTMRREELRQTRSDLLDQAAACGYSAHETKQLSDAYRLAQALTDGGYRPCGRPFINHLVGTASILMRYGFKIEIVLAGMLHTFYSHGIQHPDGAQAAIATTEHMLGGADSPVESRVRAYTKLRTRGLDACLATPCAALHVAEAEIMLIALATEIEVRLSGETRYSTRNASLPAGFCEYMENVCEALQIQGMAASLNQLQATTPVAAELQSKISVSYRLKADKRQATPMSNNLLAAPQKISNS